MTIFNKLDEYCLWKPFKRVFIFDLKYRGEAVEWQISKKHQTPATTNSFWMPHKKALQNISKKEGKFVLKYFCKQQNGNLTRNAI